MWRDCRAHPDPYREADRNRNPGPDADVDAYPYAYARPDSDSNCGPVATNADSYAGAGAECS